MAEQKKLSKISRPEAGQSRIIGRKIRTDVGLFIILLAVTAFAAVMFYFAGLPDLQLYNLTMVKPKAKTGDTEQKILFATNGSKTVYKVQRDGKWVVIVDGQESQPYDFVSTPTFSSDGSQFAYSAVLNGQYFIVLNNVPKKNFYSNIGGIAFSPDGQKLAYVANKGEQFVVVLNDKESRTYQQVDTLDTSTGETYFVFSQDSQNMAYKVTENNQSFIVVNDQEGKRYTDVSNLTFVNGTDQYTYQALDGNTQVTVVNQTETVNNNNQNNSQNNPVDINAGQPANSPDSGQIIKYKKNTRDLNLDPGRLQYSTCVTTGSCNF